MDDIEVDINVFYRPWGSPLYGARAERTPWQRNCIGRLGRRPLRQEVPRTETPRGDPAAEVGTSRRSGRTVAMSAACRLRYAGERLDGRS